MAPEVACAIGGLVSGYAQGGMSPAEIRRWIQRDEVLWVSFPFLPTLQ